MPSAEPALMYVWAFARSFHGPVRLPLGDSYTPFSATVALDSITA